MTLIENPARPEAQAIFLKGHLKMLSLGMKNSRISGTQMLKLATNITGVKYKRGQYKEAIKDLNEFSFTFDSEE